ncbi:trypsin-like peptidase domain-containing protein [Fluviicola chungangensis]|uniref:PDZ domain-containing protein n=1 Tax=Fluviicola chungangensis TaxID=2597671 RepID=A0A556N644_9FLAO|nr:trypsin-like peptidase domain-containing protein [Fluviicola chungangensis]TSJ47656.1 PDZ domain-containing protein [Fluviicola chungangensis]
MNNSLKYLGLGIVGGMIPFAFGFLLSHQADTPLSEQVIDGNRLAKTVSYNGMPPAEGASFVEASENTINSVVHVTTKVVRTQVQRDPFYEFFYGPGTGGREFKQYGSGSGSGVIVSSEGYIVTNNHVIQDASEIEVILNDNSKYTATVIGTDPSTDIAVLKIDAPELKPIAIGNSDDLRVGEWVLAVGNPFNLTSTVTAGIVSAKARNINLLSDRTSNSNVPIESFIQTDAAVNPGNSGGALVNTRGELIGINTAIASQTGSYTGYSFAVPVNLVNKVMRDIIDFGIVQRAYLGVQISDISQEIKEKNKLPSTRGVFVSAVTEDGGADKAGVKKNWVILKVGSREVNSVASLQEEIGKRRPGDKVNLTLRTEDGTEVIKEILLRSADGETVLKSKEEMSKTTALGGTFAELTAKEKKELNISYGVKLKTLEPGKLKSSGLTEGDIVTKINQTQIESVEQLTRILNSSKGGVLLEILSESGKKEYVGFGL